MGAQSRRAVWGGYLRTGLVALVPPASRNRIDRRLLQLLAGLILYGISDSFLVLGGLGLDPWDVFQQGLARHSAIPIGTWSILVGIAVLFLWIPLRQRPGIGTLLNAIIIGAIMDVILGAVAPPHALWLRVVLMAAGVGLNGVATGAYIGAGLGPGPRDGLMVGLAARGYSLRLVRTLIEVTVLIAGWLLGGNVGVGTLAYALTIGPLAHIFIPRFTVSVAAGTARAGAGVQG
jgi:uncharacterized membrane protein YczE